MESSLAGTWEALGPSNRRSSGANGDGAGTGCGTRSEYLWSCRRASHTNRYSARFGSGICSISAVSCLVSAVSLC